MPLMTIAGLDLTLPTAALNLALDEALLLEAEAGRGGEVLRLWEWPEPVVVLGAAGQVAVDVDQAACARDRVPIRRRASGGGTVLLGRGCLLFSLVLRLDRHPALRDINASYRFILERLRAGLSPIAPTAVHAGISDLAIEGRKFSGNAQQRKRTYLLHHGTLLYAVDLAAFDRYLRLPERQPDYRRGRAHAEFVTNLPTNAAVLKQLLRTEWEAGLALSVWPEDRTAELERDKYGRDEWTMRR